MFTFLYKVLQVLKLCLVGEHFVVHDMTGALVVRWAIIALQTFTTRYHNCILASNDEPVVELEELANRIHELTRWISVSEQMPTIEDADARGNVLWWSLIGHSGAVVLKWNKSPEWGGKIVYTHWQRIEAPKGGHPIKDHIDRFKPHVVLYMETRDSDLTCTGVIYNDLVDAVNNARKLHAKGYANAGAYIWNDDLKRSKVIKNKPETP